MSKQNPKSGGSIVRRMMRIYHFAISSIAPRQAPDLRYTPRQAANRFSMQKEIFLDIAGLETISPRRYAQSKRKKRYARRSPNSRM
jgi:hypothetical protein